MPYGTKGATTVISTHSVRAASRCAQGQGIVVACNTVSAVAPERLRVELDIPVLGVIEPGARAAVAATRTGPSAFLQRPGPSRRGRIPGPWRRCRLAPKSSGKPAPLLVPLAEEGWTAGDVPRLVVRRYIEPLALARADVVLLGCTHYPLLREVIEAEVRARSARPGRHGRGQRDRDGRRRPRFPRGARDGSPIGGQGGGPAARDRPSPDISGDCSPLPRRRGRRSRAGRPIESE